MTPRPLPVARGVKAGDHVRVDRVRSDQTERVSEDLRTYAGRWRLSQLQMSTNHLFWTDLVHADGTMLVKGQVGGLGDPANLDRVGDRTWRRA